MRKKIIKYLFVFMPFYSIGQEYLRFKYLNNDLLRNVEINNVYVDKTGMAWILTNNGFMSFDGSDVKRFKDTLPGSYSNTFKNIPSSICEDQNNNLYAWKYELGIIAFNIKSGTYSVCPIEAKDNEKFRNASVNELYIDSDNIIWVTSGNVGLIKYSLYTHKAKFIELSTENLKNLQLEEDDRWKKRFGGISPHFAEPNKLWVTNGKSILEFDKLSEEFKEAVMEQRRDPMKSGYVITDILDVNTDTLVFTAIGGGVGVYLKKEMNYQFFLRDSSKLKGRIKTYKNKATRVFKHKESDYIVSYDDGLPAFVEGGSGKHFFLTRDSLLNGYRVYVDNLGRVWAFTRNNIFYSEIKQLAFGEIDISFQQREKFAPNVLSCISWDEKKSKYYAGISFSDGVSLWNKNFSRITVYPIKVPNPITFVEPFIWDIVNDNENSWAIGSANYILVLDDRKNCYRHYPLVLRKHNNLVPVANDGKGEKALDFLRTAQGKFYVLTGEGEIYKIDEDYSGSRKIISFKDSSSTKPRWGIGKIMVGSEDDVLFVTDYSTIYKVDLTTGRVTSFRPMSRSAPQARNFIDVEIDQNNNLWVANAVNEIECYSGKNFKLIGKFPEKVYLTLVNNLLITRENVLLVGEPNSLKIYDINKKKLFRYNIQDGLLSKGLQKVLYENGYVFLSYEDHVQYIPLSDLLKEQHKPIAYLTGIFVYNTEIITDSLLKWQHSVELDYNQNFLSFQFSSLNLDFPDQVKYQYRLAELDSIWVQADFFNRRVNYTNLRPGTYTFEIKASLPNSGSGPINKYIILIKPAWWQTDLFKISIIIFAALTISGLAFWRIHFVRQQERQKALREKELLELEAKALRAQMNPHFIFNCLNSIKALIQEDEKHKATEYLTTFSKLIRTLFQNSDKRQISLFDEVETCRLYTQLEAMRLKGKLNYNFIIDPNVDLKSVMVPALIIQPFIENAIWHGIVPKDEGTINVSIKQNENAIVCEVDDNGIGRELSKINKPITPVIHESKGVHLSQARIDLEKKLNDTNASIETIDKYDNGQSAGTKVVITFNLQ